jgi:hypothetical protein
MKPASLQGSCRDTAAATTRNARANRSPGREISGTEQAMNRKGVRSIAYGPLGRGKERTPHDEA